MFVLTGWLALCAATALAAEQATVQQPRFRAGVDLVVVDVVVVGKGGAPVTDLTAEDFDVRAGGRTRRVVSSQFVATKSRAGGGANSESSGVPGPSSNERLPAAEGRSILFVVDTDEIRRGEGRAPIAAIAEHVDGMASQDRVGILALPHGRPFADFTTDRRAVRDAIAKIVGTSLRMNDPEMSPGEAEGIAAGDTRALLAWWERTSGLPPPSVSTGVCPKPTTRPIEQPQTVSGNCREKAERTLDRYRRHSRNLLDSLRALAEAMEVLDGQKALILVSEGLYNDPTLRADLRRFAAAAEKARVTLYALHLQAPLMEAATAGGNTAASRVLDDRVGFDGMASVANAAGGTAFRSIAHPASILARIDAELGGFYLLAFERTADDVPGRPVRIEVGARRRGLDVRARTEFTVAPLGPIAAAPGVKAAPRALMGGLLRQAAPQRDLRVDVDTFVIPHGAATPGADVMVAAEIDAVSLPADLGFEVTSADGRVVADAFEPGVSLRPLAGRRSLYSVRVSLTPGRYTLVLGVIDGEGESGSVRHHFEVKPWPMAGPRVSDLMVGEIADGRFRPAARVSGVNSLAVRLELQSDSVDALDGRSIQIQISQAEAVVATALGRLTKAPDGQRLVGTTVVDVQGLPPGDYIIRATLDPAPGEPAIQSSRLLRRK